MGGRDPAVRGGGLGADRAAVEAVHHRAVSQHDRRSPGRRSPPTSRASCSRRTRPASGTSTRSRSPAASGRRSRSRPPTRPTPCRYFPKDDRILFTRDQGGNELNHLYVRTPDGQERDLTPGEKLKAAFAGWTPDGSAFYVATNERDPRFFDIYRYDAKTYERTLLLQERARLLPGRRLRRRQVGGADEARTPPTTATSTCGTPRPRRVTHLTPHKGDAQFTPATFDPASKYLYYLTNDGGEFTALRRYALAAGTHEDVEKADWDIVFTVVLARRPLPGHRRQRGRPHGHHGRRRPRPGKPVALPAIPERRRRRRVDSRAARSKLAFYVNGDRSPNDLYVLQTRRPATPTQADDSLSPEIDPADLVDTQVVRFKARDGDDDPEHPLEAAPGDGREPRRRRSSGCTAARAARRRSGYSAVDPVPRQPRLRRAGHQQPRQLGYGKTFFAADDRKHGREPLWDCVDAKKYLASLPYVDAQPHRHHRRQLRRLHGAGGARLPAGRVRRRRRHLRRLELAADAREHPGVVGGAAQGALRGDRRPGTQTRRCSTTSRRSSTPTRSASR